MRTKWITLICLALCLLFGVQTAYAAENSATATIDLIFDGMTFTDSVQVEWNERYVVPEGGVKWDGTEEFVAFDSYSEDDIREVDDYYYIDGQIVFIGKEDGGFENIEQIVARYNGRIIGYIALTESYAIEMLDVCTFEDLNRTIEGLKKEELIYEESVGLSYVYPRSINDDPWSSWPEYPEEWDNRNEMQGMGNNTWRATAINARDAWVYKESMRKIRVGIIDAAFPLKHSDIDYALISDVYYQKGIKYDRGNDEANHGTLSAGIIASKHNNEGCGGIFPNGEIVAVGVYGKNDTDWLTCFTDTAAFATCINNKSEIINISLGINYLGGMLQFGVDPYYNTFFESLERQRIDYLVIAAAGNKNDDTKYSQYLVHVNNRYFQDRLIVVSGFGWENGNAVFIDTQCWGEDVDILAPGVCIFSTALSTYNGNRLNYIEDARGSSYAAPHVAGVAAMIKSIDPLITGPEIKNILLSHGEEIDDSHGYSHPVLDAYACVVDAFENRSTGNGTLSVTVKNKDTDQYIYGVDVDIEPLPNCVETETISENMGSNYPYTKQLKLGQYQVTISKDGYTTYTETIAVTRDSIIDLNVSLKPTDAPQITKGTLNGTVTLNSIGVSGIEVYVTSGTTRVATLITNDAGQFTADLDPGAYALSIDADGYVPVSRSTTIFAGKTTAENIELDDSMYATVEMRIIDYLNHFIINIHNAKNSVEQIDFKLTLVNGTVLYDTTQGIINDSWRIEDEIVFILDDELMQGSELVVTATDGTGRRYEGSIMLGGMCIDGRTLTLVAR